MHIGCSYRLKVIRVPGALGLPSGGAEKGVNSKQEKFYLAGNWGGSYCGGTDGNRIFKFDLSNN